MQIAIVDDEKYIRDMLKEKLLKLYPHFKILTYVSGKEFLLTKESAEIILLDIQMPDMDGMETARNLRAQGNRAVIIFITAIEEYVFQAFDVKAFHYLVKPFSDEKFKSVISLAVADCNENPTSDIQNEEKSIVIKMGGKYSKILVNEILYAEVFNRKIMIHKRNESIEYYGKMSDLENQLGEDFFRSHRSFLVNLKYVEKYNSSTIFLGHEKILMAKQNYKEFVKGYMKYIQRTGKI